ncbi:similar to Saccharomyces cerevisiae YMR275C BUL1 Ubiquitin-binding component of the Rsp5p E3-ubiquitin ligase complex [Maudiozyma saulgeensis]|uniref:Similar to Saccharomyces cerevisiae YMR275C BUL1 Ubiquitin-binding component of the Rsp5p E3-ubiquitin ligase complex n=1 Tax=Maudiozyma saulgeensis TaxID=1789683 RepID=A0A1X7R8S1_9SACH|nr:similar to Saccharomyces cerevisiae YMR275C BUL1 Ubiquitin-binding component of the Rsp5p E3-ubiquitin ligase complex [Kazachstania saulgeensis]
MTKDIKLQRPPLITSDQTRGRTVDSDSSSNNRKNTDNSSNSRSRSRTNWIRSASTSNIIKLPKSSPSRAPHKISESPIRKAINHLTQQTSQPAAKPPLHASISESSIMSSIPDPLDTADSNNIVVDVLPSFEMYNTLHRHIPQGNVNPDLHDFPPNYFDVQAQNRFNLQASNTSSSSSSTVTTTTLSQQQRDHLLNTQPTPLPSTTNIINNLHPLTTQHLTIESTRHSYDNDTTSIQDDIDEDENIFIDKLYTLPKKHTPIDIDIRITKHPSNPPEKPEEESILKEYTTGDVIHGYCVVENKSTEPLKFEMFYVTLEAYISLIDRQKGKRTVKRFLRMVDLSASWSYGNILTGSGFRLIPNQEDFDHSFVGLPNRRILEPGVKHKKFFMFKFPKQLLDVTCKQEHFAHCLLPPSFGIDKYRNNCKYSGIKVNSVLGCGHLGCKGSPILTYDLVDENVSINYTIDARIVGKDQMSKQLNIMKEKEYNIRYIPFGFDSSLVGERDPNSQLKDLMMLVDERLEAIKTVFNRLEKNEPIKNQDIHGTDLSGTIENDTELDSSEILRNKLNQLHIKNRTSQSYQLSSQDFEKRTFEPETDIIESELSYKLKSKSKSTTKSLFSSFRSSTSLSGLSSSGSNGNHNNSTSSGSSNSSKTNIKTERFGLILLQSKVPHKSIKYLSPSLLKKTNVLEAKTKQAQENWNALSDTIPASERDALKRLDLTLTCIQSNNSSPHPPPEIQAVSTELIVITGKSENSIPIKVNSRLLMDEDKLDSIRKTFTSYLNKIKDYNDQFIENKDKLNELYNVNRSIVNARELKFTNFISSQIYNDIESLANIKVKIQSLADIFKKQLDTLKEEDDPSLELTPVNSGSTTPQRKKPVKIVNAKGGLGTSATISRNSISNRFTDQIIHQWEQKSELQYERKVNVNLEFNANTLETLVPSFESCLCCRFYCVRVNIKFHHIGSTSIDIPISVKNF